MRKRLLAVVGLTVFFLVAIAAITPCQDVVITPERKAYLATKPYKGITLELMLTAEVFGTVNRYFADFWEKETGGKVKITTVPFQNFHEKIFFDLLSGRGKYDAYMGGVWWYGDYFRGKGYIIPIDDYIKDPKFPQWGTETILPGIEKYLTWGGKWYGIPLDHDTITMYYRRDILENPEYQARFKKEFGYDLPVPPQTTKELIDAAKFFNGWDWDKDGKEDYGVGLHLQVGANAVFFTYLAWAAPYVISPENDYFYFNPQNMKPLINSPGHKKALRDLVELTKCGPRAMIGWNYDGAWDIFLKGDTVFCCSFGDLGGLVEDPERSIITGKLGLCQMPGTVETYNPLDQKWVKMSKPNIVGNTLGGSWSYVISRYSEHPEATYDFLAYLARPDNMFWMDVRGWDGIDPGRTFVFLEPRGTAKIEEYIEQGWNADDVREFTNALYNTYSNPLQQVNLRIPGADEYFMALDVAGSRALTGELSADEALDGLYKKWEEITNKLGRETQLELYRSGTVGYK